MASKPSNGYLRQGEFRRWAQSVDKALEALGIKVSEHGELLAVVKDRRKTSDARQATIGALVASVVAAIVSGLLHYFR